MNEIISMIVTVVGIGMAAGIGITVAVGLPVIVILWVVKKLDL